MLPGDPSLTQAITLPFTSEKDELMIAGPPKKVLSPTQTLSKIENIWFSSIKMALGNSQASTLLCRDMLGFEIAQTKYPLFSPVPSCWGMGLSLRHYAGHFAITQYGVAHLGFDWAFTPSSDVSSSLSSEQT